MVLAPPGRGLQFEKQSRLNQGISVYQESNGQMFAPCFYFGQSVH